MSRRRARSLIMLLVVAAAIAKALAELRPKTSPDVTRHPTVDGGDQPPDPAKDPYQGPVVEPAVIDNDLAPVTPLEDPKPADRAAVATAARHPEPLGDRTWVPPEDGTCPEGFPVKAKLASGIFHQPGQTFYDRTAADRCYPNVSAALDDGLRAAKR